jgi:hypothetical protein
MYGIGRARSDHDVLLARKTARGAGLMAQNRNGTRKAQDTRLRTQGVMLKLKTRRAGLKERVFACKSPDATLITRWTGGIWSSDDALALRLYLSVVVMP